MFAVNFIFRATIEEGYAKSLGKICKPTNTGIG